MDTPSEGSWNATVVIQSSNNWDGVRLHDRQLAESLSAHMPVLFVDPPISLLSAYRKGRLSHVLREPRLQIIGPRLARLSPLVLPAMERRFVAWSTQLLMARLVRAAVRQLGGSVGALVESSVLVPVIGRVHEQLSVYWAQDDFVGSAELLGLSAGRIAQGESEVLSRAQLVIAANPTVAERLEQRGHSPVLIPYGCDLDMFSTTDQCVPAAEVHLPRPIAGFIGHIGDRIEIAMLEAVARSGSSLLLVGPQHPRFEIERMKDLLAMPNVQWVGPKDFEELPSYLAHMDVGLVPYNSSAFNIGSFPLKTLEYLAAGLAVVATDLPAIRWLDCPDIAVASAPGTFAEAVAAALAAPLDASALSRRRVFASAHTWAARATVFAQSIDDARSGSEQRVPGAAG